MHVNFAVTQTPHQASNQDLISEERGFKVRVVAHQTFTPSFICAFFDTRSGLLLSVVSLEKDLPWLMSCLGFKKNSCKN